MRLFETKIINQLLFSIFLIHFTFLHHCLVLWTLGWSVIQVLFRVINLGDIIPILKILINISTLLRVSLHQILLSLSFLLINNVAHLLSQLGKQISYDFTRQFGLNLLGHRLGLIVLVLKLICYSLTSFYLTF